MIRVLTTSLLLALPALAQPPGGAEAAKLECARIHGAPQKGQPPSEAFTACMEAKGFRPPPPGFRKAFEECGKIFGFPKRPDPPSEALVGCMTRKGFPPPKRPSPPKGK